MTAPPPASGAGRTPAEADFVIVGGGIGGLTLALSLLRAGLTVRIFERLPAVADTGVGLILWANALRVLKGLGVYDRVLSLGKHNGGFGLATSKGRAIFTIAPEEQRRGGPLEMLCLHRGDLVGLLLESLPEETVTFDAWCKGIKQHRSSVEARFEYGPSVKSRLLIGADGPNSAIRRELFGFQKPRYAGYTCWQGIVPDAAAELVFKGEVWGPAARFRMVPIGRGRVYWMATETAPANQKFGFDERKNWLAERFHGWAYGIPELIAATPNQALSQSDVMERSVPRAWGKDRVVLLGDAVHTLTPNLAQGAGMAIEDAAVLGRLLGRQQDISLILRRYQSIRESRVTHLLERSRELGSLAHLPNAMACWLRNRGLRMVSAESQRQRLLDVVEYDASAVALT